MIKVFNEYGQAGYKDLPEIKKEVRKLYLKKKLDFIPKINLQKYMQISEDLEIEKDTSTQVFIQTPRYGQYFYPSDFPLGIEGSALSYNGDFSDDIVWTSSIDGELGKGKKLSVRLTIGDHIITAVATNGETVGTVETLIHVMEDPRFINRKNPN